VTYIGEFEDGTGLELHILVLDLASDFVNSLRNKLRFILFVRA